MFAGTNSIVREANGIRSLFLAGGGGRKYGTNKDIQIKYFPINILRTISESFGKNKTIF